jgi:2-desacetyl-2-hydroxyethyl bacteriochlorophyllide A dehydrogenase
MKNMEYKKILVSEPNKVELVTDRFDQKIEDPHDVIIRNMYSQVSAGTELACLAGIESWFPIPGTPGYVSVGEVIESGPANENLNPGDIVYCYGPHSQLFKIQNGDRWSGLCLKVPEGLDPDIASFTRMANIAITALRVSKIEIGDYVAVTGLGPIGNIAAQLAQLQGARVLGLDISERRLEIARESGLLNVVNSSDKNLDELINDFTRKKGFSTYIDASGLSPVIEKFLKYISLYGEGILLGSPRAAYESNLTDTLRHIHLWTHGSIDLKGALEFRFPTHEIEFEKHSSERNARIIMDLLLSGKLKVKPFYTHKVSPDQAAEIYRGLREKKDEYIGVVFDWTSI